MTVDYCGMPIGTNRVCTLPGEHPHDNGCEDPPRLRCTCSHPPAVHFRRYLDCWITPCGCPRVELPEETA